MPDAGESYKELSSRVYGLESDVRNVTKAISDLSENVRRLSERVVEKSSTPWGTLGAWAGVVVMTIGGMGFLSLEPMKETLVEVKKQLHQHITLPSHAAAGQALEDLKNDYQRSRTELVYSDRYIKQEFDKKVEALDTVLQREMRLLDAHQIKNMEATKEVLDKLEALFHKSNQQITKDLEFLKAKTDSLNKTINDIQNEQQRRTDRVYKKNGR